jgi:putative SOS response-associated peptidase YedK
MCGRYTSTSSVADLAALFEVDEVRTEPLPPRWNVAPSQPVYAVAASRSDQGKGPRRVLGTFRWGLVPSWAREPTVGSKMINARAEGIASKPAFRAALSRRRCLLPADQFYEWQRRADPAGSPRGKQPWAFQRADGRPMALAGLWEVWRDRERPDEPLRTATVITTSANSLMAPIHDRMPVVLDPACWGEWLDPDLERDRVLDLLRPAPEGVLRAWPVTTRVNLVDHDGPELLEPLPASPTA